MTPSSFLFHIPHASTDFPFRDGFTRPELIAGELDMLTDSLVAGFSRVFCDVEKSVPDELEPMAGKRMGFYYTKTDDGQPFREEGEWKVRALLGSYRQLNRPCAGSMVPLKFLGTEPRVLAIMIEVNRSLYPNGRTVLSTAVEQLRDLTKLVVQRVTLEDSFRRY